MEKKKRQDLELQAIGTILEVLENVPEDRRKAVLDYVSGKLSISSIEGESIGKNKGKGESIKEFLEKKSPKGNYQKFAVLAYYLCRYKKVEEVNSKILVDANKDAKGIRVDKPKQVLSDAKRKYAFFTDGGGGKQILSSVGEKLVMALPDQEKVAEIVKTARKQLKRKKKKKKK